MMNLDRLILRINAVLDGYAEGFEARSLASDYAAISETVRERLRQCVALIKAGNDNAALQVAEAAPPVLDIASKLAFDRSDKWREYCRANRLPTPHRLDDILIDAVNGLYSKEIGESHPLYRDYRAAVRERDENKALSVLRSIVRVNTNDKNAREEYERLSSKLRRIGLASLREALDHHRDNDIIGVMTAMEAAGLGPCKDSPAWTEGEHHREAWEKQRMLAEALGHLPEIIRIRDLGEWETTIPLLGKIRSLEKQYGFRWPPKDAVLIADIEAWVGGHAAAVEKVRREAEHREDLHNRIDELEKRAAGPDRPKALVLADIAAADLWLKEADAIPGKDLFHEPIARAHRVRSKLTGILHRRRNRLAAVYLSSAATLVVLGLAGRHLAENAATERDFRDGLAAAEKSAAVKPVHEFLEGPAKNATALAAEPAYAARIRNLRTRVDEAGRGLTQILEESSAICADTGKGAPLAGLKNRLATLAGAIAALAPDLKEEATAAAARAEKTVKDRETADGGKADGTITSAAEEVEQALARPDATGDSVRQSSDKLAAALAAAPSPVAATMERAQTDLEKAGVLAKSLDDAATAREAIKSATTLPAYLDALAALAGSGVKTPDALAAAKISASAATLGDLPPSLLPADTALMIKGSAGDSKRFVPAEPSAVETGNAATLARVAKFAGAWRATRTSLLADGSTTEARIYLKARPVSESFALNGGVKVDTTAEKFGPDGTPEKVLVTMFRFDDRNPTGARLENAVPAPEGILIPDLAGLYDTDRAVFTAAPIETLDRVLASDASPLFKAWAHRQILNILDERPEQWGTAFSPEARRDALRLKSIMPIPVDHLAWLSPEKYADLAGRLSSFYAEKRAPYRPAAEARRELVRAVLKGGVVLAGKTGLDGRPAGKVDAGEPGTRLFGLAASGEPAVLGVTDASGAAVLDTPAAPLSPLLRLGVSPAKIAPAATEAPAPGGDWNNLFFPKR